MPNCQPIAGICLATEVLSRMRGYYRTLIIIVIVIAIAIFIVLPNNPGIHFLGINKDFKTALGLDLVGGVQALLEADLPADQVIEPGQMNTTKKIVENRVNALGVTESNIQQAGPNRILVEIPGETDPDKALAAIKQTGLLEFVDFSQVPINEIQQMYTNQEIINTDTKKSDASGTNITSSATATETITSTIPSTTGITSTIGTSDSQTPKIYHTIMTGADLKRVNVNNDAGQYDVSFELSEAGAKTFGEFTTNNLNKVLAIVLDNKIISFPTIESPITNGQGRITGSFTADEANALAIQLRYGSLPIPLTTVITNTVGPTLGKESLQKSLIAGVIGITVVILFMAFYYRLPGIIADVALLIYVLLTFAIFKAFPVTFTLPGIAGYILSIGVAVDANILIFARMREELRAGRNLHQATDLGWSRAWPSIRDSNISTLITCGILFIFGSTFGASMVKGFSVTLAIGVLVSLFTAIIVTRTLLHLVLDNITFSEHKRWFGI
jgi:preprotein translocase subunit SecD